MDNILLAIVLIIVVVGLVIFGLKRKNNLDKAQGAIKKDCELIPVSRAIDTINSNDVVAKASELDEKNRKCLKRWRSANQDELL